MAENDILGISAHLDFDDIQKSIDQLVNGLDKIGLKTDVLSKRMNDAMNEIARSTDDTAIKNKKAMDVFAQGIAEVKLALEKYPEALRQAKNEEEATALATSCLEEQLKKLNAEFLNSNVGSEKYEKLKTSIAGVEQQINSNNLVHERQLQTIQEMEAGYNSLVSMYGIGTAALGANSVAHGAVAATTATETVAHGANASAMSKETEEYQKQKEAIDGVKFSINGLSEADTQIKFNDIGTITSRFNEMKDSIISLTNKLSTLQNGTKEYRDTLEELSKEKDYLKRFGEVYLSPPSESQESDPTRKPMGNVVGDYTEELRNQLNALKEEEEALTQFERVVEDTTQKQAQAAGNATKAQQQVTEEINRTKEAKQELNRESTKEPASFKQQWKDVNEMHSKIRELTKELQTYEEEFDKMAEKPGFDAHSKKAKELIDKINELKKRIAETKEEMHNTSGAGSFFAKLKNQMEDFITGNGKFQQSLGDMKTAVSGLIGPFSSATTGAMNFAKSLWAMAATPIGAVISVIVLGFKAIHTWMTKSAEGQRVYTKITAYLGSLLSSLTDIAVKIGKYLYHAFADAQSPLNQFGKGLVGFVINPLKMIAHTLSSVGQIAKGVFDLIASGADVAEAKRAVDEISKGWNDLKKFGSDALNTLKSGWDTIAGAAKGVLQVSKDGIESLWTGDLASWGKDVLSRARQAANLASRELELQQKMVEIKRDEKLLDIEIAKEREKIYTLTGKAKDAQIEKVKNLLKEKYQPQIKAQQELADIQAKRNRLHTTTLEQLSKEKEAQGAVYALQAQSAASTRMLVRMQEANLKSMSNADKKSERQQQQIKDAETRFEEIVRKNAVEKAKVEVEIEGKIADARIAAMKDSAEKVLSEKNRTFEKELQQIDEQRKAAIEKERARQKVEFEAREKVIKARGGKPKQWSDKEVDEIPIEAINNQYDELRKLNIKKQINEEAEERENAMTDFLKKYGSVQAQKVAIAQEYDKKIEKARTEAQKASLAEEKKRLIEELNIKELTQNIDWETIFNNIDRLTTEALKKIRDNLRAQLESGNISPENAAVISERILVTENKIAEKSNFWASLIPPLQERVRLTNQVLDAERKIASLKNDQAEKERELYKLLTDVSGMSEGSIRQKFTAEIQGGDITSIADALGIKEGSDEWQKLQVAMENYRSSLIKTTAAQENLQTLQSMLKKGGTGVFSGIGEILTNSAESAGGGIAGWMSVINTNAQSMSEFVDKIGLAETDFGQSVKYFAEGTQGFSNAVQSLLSGDIFGAVNGIIDGVVGIGRSIGSALGFSVTADYSEYNEAKSQYDRLSKVWDELISKKRQYLSESWGTEAENAADEATRLLNIEKEQNKVLARIRLGSGSSWGSHSIGYRMWEGSYGSEGNENTGKVNNGRNASNYGYITWNDVNEAIMKGLQSAGLGKVTFNSMEDLLNMSKEQLEWIKENYTGLWAHMDDDFRGALENIIKFGETEKEILDSLKKQITGTTFDDVYDSFMSNMYNMADGAKDVEKQMADDWQKSMNKMVLNNVMGEKYKQKLREWYDKWYEAYNGDNKITQSEINDLRNEYNALTKEAADEVKALREQGLIKQTNGNDQQSTYNSLEKWSYEQADDLINRATALQIIDENQYQILAQSLEVAYSTLSGVEGIRTTVQEIATAIAMTIELQEATNSKLDKIITNTNPIGEIRDLVKKLYNER